MDRLIYLRLRLLAERSELLDLLLELELLLDLPRDLRVLELVIRRLSRKLGEPALRGIDGERERRGGGVLDREWDVLLCERE